MPKFKKGDVVTAPEYSNSNDKFVILYKENYNDYKVFNLEDGDTDYIDKTYFVPAKNKPWTVVTGTVDGYKTVVASNGKQKTLSMGCQTFTNIKEARKHWSNGPDGDHYNVIAQLDNWSDADEAKDRAKANTKRINGMEKLYAQLKEQL